VALPGRVHAPRGRGDLDDLLAVVQQVRDDVPPEPGAVVELARAGRGGVGRRLDAHHVGRLDQLEDGLRDRVHAVEAGAEGLGLRRLRGHRVGEHADAAVDDGDPGGGQREVDGGDGRGGHRVSPPGMAADRRRRACSSVSMWTLSSSVPWSLARSMTRCRRASPARVRMFPCRATSEGTPVTVTVTCGSSPRIIAGMYPKREGRRFVLSTREQSMETWARPWSGSSAPSGKSSGSWDT